MGLAELTAWYAAQLGDTHSWEEVRRLPLRFDVGAFVSDAELARAQALPDELLVRDRPVPLDYDVEEAVDGARSAIVRLRLPEKLARSLAVEELPSVPAVLADRPLRFVVTRGQRGAVRADTLDDLQEKLDAPWTDEEIAAHHRARDLARNERERGGKRGGGHRSGGNRDGSSRSGGPPGGGPKRGGKGGGRRRR
jgi:hypothetical protein